MALRKLYPPLRPYASGFLERDGGHSLYWEQCGNPDGVPVVVLHGGPGAGCSPDMRRFFDPRFYRIVLFDQRGCGRSSPAGDVTHNTPEHLVADMESLRVKLRIERWHLFGGSWGGDAGDVVRRRAFVAGYQHDFAQRIFAYARRS